VNIIVASSNPVKIESVRIGFLTWKPEQDVTVSGVDTPSGISRQPMSSEETYQGAENRARAARSTQQDADFWVGVEGGVEIQPDGLAAFAWIVILSKDDRGIARSASFSLPKAISDLVLQGIELGAADDILFGRENSKQTNGAVGLLTNDRVTRTDLYAHAVVLALIPFMNPELYPEE
jgi:inosine/xanthosine triphosphatase